MEVVRNKALWQNWIGLAVSHPYTIAALLIYGGLFIPFMTLKRDWEKCLLVEAVRLCDGDTIYGHDDLYPYPPLPALLAVPFAYVPFDLGQVVFYLLNILCLCLMVRWAWMLAGGGRLQGSEPVPVREHWILLFGLMCGLGFAWNCLSHHQLDLFVGAAMIGGCLALARSRTYLAALGFGLAAAFKGPALLWGPYLAWRGRWKEGLCVAGVFVALNLLPTLLVPAQMQRLNSSGFLLAEWAERFLQPMGQSRDYPHFWYTESNQSLIGAAYRWCNTTWDWTDRFRQQLPAANPASPTQLRIFCLACAGLLFAGTMLVQGRRNLDEVRGSRGLTLECGMVFMLMLILSPMTSKAHCGTMLVPAFALARWVEDHRDRVLGTILALVLLAVLCTHNFMGDFVVCVAMWHGAVTWASLLLLAGCGYVLQVASRLRQREE